MNLVVTAIQETADDDLDEDNQFGADKDEHEQALALARDIAAWIKHHPDGMIQLVLTELPEIG